MALSCGRAKYPVMRALACLLLAALAVSVAPAVWPRDTEPSAAELVAHAVRWAGPGRVDAPRRDGDEWEVDVTRANGSLVEVTLGSDGRLRALDEERAAQGGPADDELRGGLRVRAARAALAAAGPGAVLGVERERPALIEVSVRRAHGGRVEVALGRGLRVLELEDEDPGDE
jgi:hypothetical protein